MSLTGWPLLVLAVALAVLLPVAALLLWQRVHGPAPVAVGQRLALVVAGQLAAVLAVAVGLNDNMGFYASWSDLLGGGAVPVALPALPHGGHAGSVQWQISIAREAPFLDPPTGVAAALRSVALPLALPQPAIASPAPGQDARLVTTFYGPDGMAAPAEIDLPPEYFDPAYRSYRFPVIVAFPGFPGSVHSWTGSLALEKVVTQEEQARRLGPAVVAVVQETVKPPLDTECANWPGQGPRVTDFLAQQVPAWILRNLRVREDHAGWAALGYSTGAYCAARVALVEPHVFGAAAMMSGYFSPVDDARLEAGHSGADEARLVRYSLFWRLRHEPVPQQRLLVVSSRQDADSWPQTEQFLAHVPRPLQVSSILLSGGGHNTRVWRSVLPDVLDWIGRQVSLLPRKGAPSTVSAAGSASPAAHPAPPARGVPAPSSRATPSPAPARPTSSATPAPRATPSSSAALTPRGR